MEPYFEQMGRAGVKALIGKGEISPQAMKILEAYHMAYFTTIGGIGAFLSEKVQAAQIICFPELGPEAVFCLSVKGFPVFYEIY
jgi:fumarate hydratase subunit beta